MQVPVKGSAVAARAARKRSAAAVPARVRAREQARARGRVKGREWVPVMVRLREWVRPGEGPKVTVNAPLAEPKSRSIPRFLAIS